MTLVFSLADKHHPILIAKYAGRDPINMVFGKLSDGEPYLLISSVAIPKAIEQEIEQFDSYYAGRAVSEPGKKPPRGVGELLERLREYTQDKMVLVGHKTRQRKAPAY